MKLRLENGNFKITGTCTYDDESQTVTIDDLPKGMSAEDFIGCVVDMGIDGLHVITSVYEPSENVVAFELLSSTMNYDRLTGKVTRASNVLPPDEHVDPVDPGIQE